MSKKKQRLNSTITDKTVAWPENFQCHVSNLVKIPSIQRRQKGIIASGWSCLRSGCLLCGKVFV